MASLIEVARLALTKLDEMVPTIFDLEDVLKSSLSLEIVSEPLPEETDLVASQKSRVKKAVPYKNITVDPVELKEAVFETFDQVELLLSDASHRETYYGARAVKVVAEGYFNYLLITEPDDKDARVAELHTRFGTVATAAKARLETILPVAETAEEVLFAARAAALLYEWENKELAYEKLLKLINDLNYQKLDKDGTVPLASRLETARTIKVEGGATGETSFDGSRDVAISLTVDPNEHKHLISHIKGLQVVLDSKVSGNGGTVSNSLKLGGHPVSDFVFGNDSSASLTITNWNGISKSGFYKSDGGSNAPANSTLFYGFNTADATSHKAGLQIVGTDDSGYFYGRVRDNTGAGAWDQFYTNAYHPVADQLTTGRKIKLKGDVTGEVTFDGSRDVSFTVNITADSHGHKASEITGLEDALVSYLKLTGGTMKGDINFTGEDGLTWYNNTDSGYIRHKSVSDTASYMDFGLADNPDDFYQWTWRDHRNGATENWMRLGRAKLEVYGDTVGFYSDKRLKENIKPIENALETVCSWQGITYNANELAKGLGGFDTSVREIGLFAQDVQSTTPEAVRPAPFDIDEEGNSKSGEHYLTLKYERTVPVLVEAVKSLTTRLERTEDALARAEALIRSLADGK